MIFFFKPKKIHLDCFTNRNDVYSYFPIVEGNKTFPEWWKKLPKTYNDDVSSVTMKSCVGFIDFFRNSISLRLWSDLIIHLQKNPEPSCYWKFSDGISKMDVNSPQRLDGFVDPTEHLSIKIDSPWAFSCKEDIQWVTVGNNWNKNTINKFTNLNGILNFKYQSSTNIQIMCDLPKKYEKNEIFLPYETNLLNFFPMSERPVQIHNHLISDEEFKKYDLKMSGISFSNIYRNIKKIVDNNESKCPFGFKK